MVSVCSVYSPTEEAAQPPMKPPQERKERVGAVTSRLGQAVLTSSLLGSTPGHHIRTEQWCRDSIYIIFNLNINIF